MNSKIVLDRRADVNGVPVVMIYGIVVGETFGIEDGLRRFVGANTTVIQLPGKRYVEPSGSGLGGECRGHSPEDILENHFRFEYWLPEARLAERTTECRAETAAGDELVARHNVSDTRGDAK